jgi:hypothetical protein
MGFSKESLAKVLNCVAKNSFLLLIVFHEIKTQKALKPICSKHFQYICKRAFSGTYSFYFSVFKFMSLPSDFFLYVLAYSSRRIPPPSPRKIPPPVENKAFQILEFYLSFIFLIFIGGRNFGTCVL